MEADSGQDEHRRRSIDPVRLKQRGYTRWSKICYGSIDVEEENWAWSLTFTHRLYMGAHRI